MAAGATYDPIGSATLTATATTITFSSIPNTYSDLVLIIQPYRGTSTTNADVLMRFNSDSGSNYNRFVIQSSGTTASTSAVNPGSATFVRLNYATAIRTNGMTQYQAEIPNYTSGVQKNILSQGYFGSSSERGTDIMINRWASTNAINRIDIFSDLGGNYGTGSTFSLYGIARA